jgi:hypothetical protein
MQITNLQDLKILADSFQTFCIGLGALAASLVTIFKVVGWYSNKQKISYLKKIYPVIELDHSFKLVIQPSNNPKNSQIFLVDLRDNSKHHIRNLQTLTDLDMFTPYVDRNFSKDEFDKLVLKDYIDTKRDEVFTFS